MSVRDGAVASQTGQRGITVAVIADVRLHRDALACLLAGEPGIEVVATATSDGRGLERVARAAPDVALVDVRLLDPGATARALAGAAGAAHVVVLSVPDPAGTAAATEELDALLALARLGICAWIGHRAGREELLATIRGVVHEDGRCAPWLAALLLRHTRARAAHGPASRDAAGAAPLTRREAEVYALVREGCSNKEIAARLCIAVATVKNHVHSILAKLELRSRTDALDPARTLRPRELRVLLPTTR